MTPFPSHSRLTGRITCISLAGDRIKVPSTSLSEQDKATLEEEISNFKSDDEDTKTLYVPLLLDDKVAHGHYDGYCKQSEFSAGSFDDLRSSCHSFSIALWPLFHYLLWQDVSPNSLSASFSADEHWAPYEQANAAFARRILDVYRPGDLIWVHDYHLLLVPKLLRLMLPEVCLGLFVHTPWPSSEVFRCLPRMYATSSDDTGLIFSCIRAEGNTGWHARCQYCMLPNLLVLASLHVVLRASMWLRGFCTWYRCPRSCYRRDAYSSWR